METNDLALLHQKLDYLTEQFEAQRRVQEEWAELKRDLIPIANHMMKLSIEELAEIGNDFETDDLLFLLKRLLRDTHLLVGMLGQLESLVELGDETSRLIQPIFNQTVEGLNELEQKGYFAFLRGLTYVADRVVTEFKEQDVRELGDNIVTILTTVRHMTQPQVLSFANSLIQTAVENPVEEGVSTWRLLRELGDPKVRQGMARMLNIVKSMADQNPLDSRQS
ncbi:MAG: DUF1641 domain-containing protein [Anaerolineae bacterium]|nr:DUF1641 domain-containing protein [Anaerolineae bacterium]